MFIIELLFLTITVFTFTMESDSSQKSTEYWFPIRIRKTLLTVYPIAGESGLTAALHCMRFDNCSLICQDTVHGWIQAAEIPDPDLCENLTVPSYECWSRRFTVPSSGMQGLDGFYYKLRQELVPYERALKCCLMMSGGEYRVPIVRSQTTYETLKNMHRDNGNSRFYVALTHDFTDGKNYWSDGSLLDPAITINKDNEMGTIFNFYASYINDISPSQTADFPYVCQSNLDDLPEY